MQSIKLRLVGLAFLLVACSPGIEAQEPTATVINTPANNAVPTNTQVASVASTPTLTSTAPAPTEAASTKPAAAATAVQATPATAATPAAIAAALSQEPEYENLASPVDLLASYYNAVNRQEYERAYGYRQEAPLDYASFASGYADTASVQVIVQPPTRIEGAAGSLYAEIPTVLIAQHTDGSVHSFAGCIVTRKSNITEGDVWHLYQARLAEVDNNDSIPTLLAQGCAS